jgi:hypothetical protein
MKRIPFWLIVVATVALAASGGRAISAQDKYTLQVPDGLAFAEFRGYEDWQVVSISQTSRLVSVLSPCTLPSGIRISLICH